MIRRDEDFDAYLGRLAAGLGGEAFVCTAVLPEVDGGLLFAVRDRAGRRHVVRLRHGGEDRPEGRRRFVRGTAPAAVAAALERAYVRFVARQPHPLLGFRGRDIGEILLRRGGELPEVWRDELVPGRTRWSSFVLEALELRSGALYVAFADRGRTVRLRLTDREDPRLADAGKVLLVGNLALSLVEDGRTQPVRPSEQAERFLAYLVAHTTGRTTRIRGDGGISPSVTLYGREVELNPFLPEGRQGASGMAAALSGRVGRRLKVVVLGDASCRQTFPPLRRLPFFDSWSYFPVGTAPEPGSWIACDFSERDVVVGAEERLERLLRGLRAEDPEVKVALVQTCVSRLIGDDVRGVLRKVLGDDGFVILDPDFQARDSAVDSLLWPWVLRAFRKPVRQRRSLVNLVGLGGRGSPSGSELAEVLGTCGVRVNARLFPSFREEELECFDAAPLTVVGSCSIVQSAFRRVDRAAGRTRWVRADPPFGLEGTRRWVETVVRESGGGDVPRAARELLARRSRECLRELAPLRAALRGTAIALVAQSRFAAWVFDPSEIFGIRILELLTELGLEVELFLQQDVPPPRDLLEAVQGRDRVTLRVFDDADELRAAVAGSRAKLLLTSIRRNVPALALGKVPVFVQAFELGFDGAVRTARRLAAHARFDFVERYGKYIR
ncbi:MAG: hypothetical protein JXB32_17530 [Deltaproteobacteria bacterium]|nr:hypothetical protein [Deltaproteobacteria bacterium]